MEDLIKKVSYLKGYADGLDISPKSDEGKLIMKLLDVLGEMAEAVEELTDRVEDVEDVVDELGRKDNNMGFILPPMSKSAFFKTVIFDGALPRKTFSMGEANEKRYYLECRRISK